MHDHNNKSNTNIIYSYKQQPLHYKPRIWDRNIQNMLELIVFRSPNPLHAGSCVTTQEIRTNYKHQLKRACLTKSIQIKKSNINTKDTQYSHVLRVSFSLITIMKIIWIQSIIFLFKFYCQYLCSFILSSAVKNDDFMYRRVKKKVVHRDY